MLFFPTCLPPPKAAPVSSSLEDASVPPPPPEEDLVTPSQSTSVSPLSPEETQVPVHDETQTSSAKKFIKRFVDYVNKNAVTPTLNFIEKKIDNCSNIFELFNLWYARYTVMPTTTPGTIKNLPSARGQVGTFLNRLETILDNKKGFINTTSAAALLDNTKVFINTTGVAAQLLTFRTYMIGQDKTSFAMMLNVTSNIIYSRINKTREKFGWRIYRVSLLGLALIYGGPTLIDKLLDYNLYITYDDVMFIKHIIMSDIKISNKFFENLWGVTDNSNELRVGRISIARRALITAIFIPLFVVDNINLITISETIGMTGLDFLILGKQNSSRRAATMYMATMYMAITNMLKMNTLGITWKS
jgi:hypothetical protein